VRALGHQPHVQVAEQRREAIGVVEQRQRAVAPSHPQSIVARDRRGAGPLEEAIGMAALQRAVFGMAIRAEQLDRGCARQEAAQPQCSLRIAVYAEHRERVGVARAADALDLDVRQRRSPLCRWSCSVR
jgi:hypothetical protein